MFSYQNDGNEEAFFVKDLYVGVLGCVSKSGYRRLKIDEVDKVVIFQREKLSSNDSYARNVFTDQKYFFFYGNFDRYSTVYKTVNRYAISRYFPVDSFFRETRKTIGRNELLELYYDLNMMIRGKMKDGN